MVIGQLGRVISETITIDWLPVLNKMASVVVSPTNRITSSENSLRKQSNAIVDAANGILGNSANNTSDYTLEQFARHIPRVLTNQLISKLIEQFIHQNSEEDSDQAGAFSCTPSITRFRAALLFVDISGFTVLSQRLPVDELRLHINAYFKKILDIVYKYDGDAIKFAGDALFIVWQMDQSSKLSFEI